MKRLFRFGVVGLSGTVVNLAVISLLIHAYSVPAVLADAIAIEVSIISNFFCNHYYTFRQGGMRGPADKVPRRDTTASVMHKLWRFNLVALGGAAISFAVFTVCYKLGGLPYYLADIIGIGVAMGWNYILSVKLVWRLVDE